MESKLALFDALAALYEYPRGDFAERVALCRSIADSRSPGRGDALRDIEERATRMTPGEVEEMFTRSFEINPVCALEVGWHVYGEEYARGALLVNLRKELRRHEIPEITELPDHLTHVLRLLGRAEPELANGIAGRYVLPALRKMLEAVVDKECPYEALLQITRDIVNDEHDAIEIEPQKRRSAPPGSVTELTASGCPTPPPVDGPCLHGPNGSERKVDHGTE
ncbi:MAG: hypothetical protein CME06_12885 [Gemmatimonadetes bacterium]|nr:hypothetical protein [Gemmatimonadota bacterium]